MKGVDGRTGKQHQISHGNQRPEHRQDAPVSNAGEPEKHSGDQHHAHVSPAVEGVQQTHGFLLVLRGARLQNGTDEHLDESPAHGIDTHSDEDSRKGIGQQVRQKRQQHQPRSCAAVGEEHAGAVAQFIHHAGGEQINAQLDQEVDGDQRRDLRERNVIAVLKYHEQQRYKIIDHRLHNIADEAGVHGLLVVFRLGHGFFLSLQVLRISFHAAFSPAASGANRKTAGAFFRRACRAVPVCRPWSFPE